jgi:hypothetical protein
LVGREIVADLLTKAIKQDRFFNDLAWKHSLGEPWDKNRIETQPTCGLDWADEDLPVTLQWRRDGSFQEQGTDNVDHFAQRKRPDWRDRRQFGK